MARRWWGSQSGRNLKQLVTLRGMSLLCEQRLLFGGEAGNAAEISADKPGVGNDGDY